MSKKKIRWKTKAKKLSFKDLLLITNKTLDILLSLANKLSMITQALFPVALAIIQLISFIADSSSM